jgi:hypothetical protein
MNNGTRTLKYMIRSELGREKMKIRTSKTV